MELYYLDALRHEVTKNFGRKILSSNDCHFLELDISKRLRTTLSFNTLRRFFHLMKASNQPSIYTLNALSVYCGFTSYDDFITSKQQAEDTTKEEDPGVLPFMISLFKNAEVSDSNDKTYTNMVYQTISYLNNYALLAEAFQREIAKTKNGQSFYFEKFINIDKLNSVYGRGLQYYVTEKGTKEAQIFAHSLLCFRSFLNGDDAGVVEHFNALAPYDRETTTVNPCFLGHFYATQLYHAFVKGNDFDLIMERARKVYASVAAATQTYESFFYFELTICCALVLTRQYDEALFYADEAFKKRKTYSNSLIEAQLLESFDVYLGIALLQTGKLAKAKDVFEKIDSGHFYPLSKQFLTILYLELKQHFRKSMTEMEQIRYLVQETGFQRLLNINLTLNESQILQKSHVVMSKNGQKKHDGTLYIRRSNQPSENNVSLMDSEANASPKI